MKNLKRVSGLLALCAATSTPSRAIDPLTATVVVGGIGLVGVGLAYLYNVIPYFCGGCDQALLEQDSYVVRPQCQHRFHPGCYAPGAVCRRCEDFKRMIEENERALERQDALELERLREQERIRKQEAYQQQLREELYLREKRAQEEAARVQEQVEQTRRFAKRHQLARDEQLARELAAQESASVRGGYATPAQACADQAEAHGDAHAQRVAQQEYVAQQQREAETRAHQTQEEEERRNNQQFVQRQNAIRSVPWMMEACAYCQCPKAQRDQNSELLIDPRDPQNKYHLTSLPCGHTFHTTCVKEAARHGLNHCPICTTEFNVREV